MLKFFLYLLVFKTLKNVHTEATWLNTAKTIAELIAQQRTLHKIIVCENSNLSIATNEVLKRVVSNNFVSVFGTKKIFDINTNLSSTSPSHLFRGLKIIVIFQENFQPEEIKGIVNFFKKMQPKRSRYKFLIVFNNPSFSTDSVQSVLRDGWLKTYFDMSIINMNQEREEQSKIFYYNPFTNSHHCEPCTARSVLFPDKLKDVNGYPVKVQFVVGPPYMTRKFVNNKWEYAGELFSTLKVFASAINFTIEVNDTLVDFVESHAGIQKSKYDMLPYPMILRNAIIKDNRYIHSKLMTLSTYRALTLNTKVMEIEVAFEKLIFTSLYFLVFLLFLHLLNQFIFRQHQISTMENVMLLLAQPTTRQPKRLYLRIIFCSVSMISMIYSPSIIAALTSVIMTKEPIIASFKDIYKSGVQTYSLQDFIQDLSIDDNEKYYKKVKAGMKIIKTSMEMIDALKEGKNVLGFAPADKASFLANTLKKPNGDFLMKLTNFRAGVLIMSYIYRSGFPFVHRIDSLITRANEAGIPGFWKNKYIRENDDGNWADLNTGLMHIQLMSVYLFGCILSSIVFAIELILNEKILRSYYIPKIFR